MSAGLPIIPNLKSLEFLPKNVTKATHQGNVSHIILLRTLVTIDFRILKIASQIIWGNVSVIKVKQVSLPQYFLEP